MVSHDEVYIFFLGIEHQHQENIPYHFLHYSFFYEIFITVRSFFYPFKIIYWKLLWPCPTIQIIYIPIIKMWWLFVFVIIFHILLAFSYPWILLHISPLIPFSTTNKISMSVSSYNFFFVFLKTACHANPGVEKKFAGLNS